MNNDNRFIPELDRWYCWMITKSWDMPYHKLVPLLDHLGIEIFIEEGTDKPYISRTDFKNFLYTID